MTERIGAVSSRGQWVKEKMLVDDRLATQRDTIVTMQQALERSERMVRQQAKRIEQLERTVYELEGDI